VTESTALEDWEDEDAGNIVHTARSLFFREVSHEMTTELIVLGHDVEKEWFDIVIERFGAEEKFCEQAEILAVDRILTAIDLEKGVFAITVDFIAWRMLCRAFQL
jgi:hypothetical protein